MSRKAIAVLLALLLLAGCAGGSGSSAPGEDGGGSAASSQGSPDDQHIQLTEEHKKLYAEYLLPLAKDGRLMGLEPLEPGFEYGMVQEIEILDAALDGDAMTLTAELYGTVLLDPNTGEEFLEDGSWIENAIALRSPADDPHAPYLPLGTTTVRLRESSQGNTFEPEVLSCDWQPIENPGHRFLESQTTEVEDFVAASEKLDLSGYDQRLVNYLYRVIRSQRLINGLEEITRWDLENLCTDLLINYEVAEEVFDEEQGEFITQPVDAELLRLIPALRTFECYAPLTDYSVFEEMDQLDSLYFYLDTTQELDLSTLRVGHANTLTIEGFRQDIAIDLTGSQVDTLWVNSWVASVTEFRGCESVKTLEFNNTRSDTRIINAETFPNVETIRMDFYSDTARVRDFSKLATFGKNVDIDLSLRYQAANNRTVESLVGVRLKSLTLAPKDGPWPLDEPDPALVELVNAGEVIWSDN